MALAGNIFVEAFVFKKKCLYTEGLKNSGVKAKRFDLSPIEY